MSTIKVNKIENTSTTDGGIEVDTSGHVKIDGQQLPTAGPLSNRNLIINGAMQVAQRGTSVTNANSAAYRTCDRFVSNVFQFGVWTINQRTGGFSDTWEAGATERFRASFEHICTTPDPSPGSTDNVRVIQYIEGQNLQHLNYGQATAKQLTLSFWVKSNKTGAASFEINQPGNSNRMFSTSYTINAADTWEKKVINIPADTSGVIDNNNGRGLMLAWWLNSGPNFTGGTHSNTWVAQTNTARNSTNLGVGGAANDNWSITGVQLEVGSKSTPFEHRSYADELARCERYFFKLDLGQATANTTHLNFCRFSVSSGKGLCYVQFPVTMRDNPTYTTSASGTFHSASGYVGVPTMDNSTTHGAQLRGASTQPVNSINYCRSDAEGETAFFNFYAEL